MSLVSHDPTWIYYHGAKHRNNPGENKANDVHERESDGNIPEGDETVEAKSRKNSNENVTDWKEIGIADVSERDETDDKHIIEHPDDSKTEQTQDKETVDSKLEKDGTSDKNFRRTNVKFYVETNYKTDDGKTANSESAADKLNPVIDHTIISKENNGETNRENVTFNTGKRKIRDNDNLFEAKDPIQVEWRKHYPERTLEKRYFNQLSLGTGNVNEKAHVEARSDKNKPYQRGNDEAISKTPPDAIVNRMKEKCKRTNWKFNSGVLISLVMLNAAGLSSAAESSSFTSTLTSRMIASFLGYPSTCTLGAEVRPCTLTLTCWLRGGTRLRGCGGWLFSCCGPPEPSREEFDNSIPSSDWKYKVSPPKLRQVPQRNGMPNNVFRRRVDDDVSQMDCGLPSSRILQKRIIGGREARFAEFPWQAHVRISEFQCGGVLVSRWFVATAAHCVSRAHTRDIAVWLGAIDTSATHHPARKIGVVQKILHPLFQFRMTQPDRYDIALLKLSRPITYMSHILPICLPDYDMDLRGRSGVIAGWGKTDASNSHTGTNMLRSATVPILSKEQCINWHQSKQISVEIHSEMICAGHSDGHQDACLGDSGGPLIVLDNGRYFLVGITSAGFGCGVDHQPGIYHNVRVTAKWIRGVIAPSVNYLDA